LRLSASRRVGTRGAAGQMIRAGVALGIPTPAEAPVPLALRAWPPLPVWLVPARWVTQRGCAVATPPATRIGCVRPPVWPAGNDHPAQKSFRVSPPVCDLA